tara:strand:+ start:1091 stop:1312 length:222 start_codon:yes stop_codon:yes gene_type:complete
LKYLLLSTFLLLLNCSLNVDSKYWTEQTNKKIITNKIDLDLNSKSINITSMSSEDFRIYADEHTKNSKYPDLD